MSTEPKRDEIYFGDVAKLTAKSESRREPAEAKDENSGMIDLAAIAAGTPSQGAAPEESAPVVEEALGSGRPATASMVRPRPAALAAQGQPAPAPSPADGPRVSAYGSRADKPARSHTGWIMLSAGMVVGAVVAGVFFRMGKADAVQSSAPVVVARSTAEAPATPRGKSEKTAATAVESRGLDPSALPLAPAIDPAAAHPQAAPAGRPANVQPGPGPAPAPAAHAGATKWTPTSPPAAAPGSDQSLEALMKRAVGANQPVAAMPATTAAPDAPKTSGEGLPAKPAMGAVQGAVGTVLPAARYCLGPDDPVSRATITFKSDGSVENVSVSGDAAGQPAEDCIRARLVTARVPPFGSPTFTWTVTVRPAS